jgi:CoA:oxalate CoA-transferase
VVESFTPGKMEKHGLAYKELSALNQRLVYASISGFGQTGPYRERGAMDITIEGISGLMSITGQPNCPPARCGYSVADLSAGMFAATAILAALVERQRSGKGQYLDTSMLDCQMTLLENALVRHLNTGEVPKAAGSRHPLVTPFQALPTKDGYITLAGVNDWTLFCWRIDRPDLAGDPRFVTNELRTQNHRELEPVLNEVFRQRTTQEWLDVLHEVCLVSPVNTIGQAVHDPQVQQREMIVELPTGSGSSLKVANTPFKFSRTQTGPQGRAPRLGEHTREALTESGIAASEIDRLASLGVIVL